MAKYGTSTTAGQNTIVGIFNDKTSAERAYDFIMDLGYSRDETSVVMSDETRHKHFESITSTDSELGTKAAEGAGVGGAIGSVVGGLVGAIAAIGTSVVLPGLGLVVAGPLAAALVGAGTGGVTGGLIGALIGSGIPDDSARSYEESIRQGGILISVLPRTDEEAERINREWKQLGGDVTAR